MKDGIEIFVQTPLDATPADVMAALGDMIASIAERTGLNPAHVFRAMLMATEKAQEAARAGKPAPDPDATAVHVPPVSFTTKGGAA